MREGEHERGRLTDQVDEIGGDSPTNGGVSSDLAHSTGKRAPARGRIADAAVELESPVRSSLRWRVPAVLFVAAAVAVAAFVGWNYLGSYESTDDAQIDGHIHPIASRIQGTVIKVFVDDTQTVHAGQTLIEIDPSDYRVALEKAQGDLAQADAQVEAAQRDYETAQAKIKAAQASNAKARADFQRYEPLFRQHAVSREQYEESIRAANVADAQVEADRASAAGAAKTIALREAAVKSAQAAVDQAQLNLSYTRINSPADGVVGKRSVEAGQRIEPGQELLSIVPLDDLWVTANFRETQLKRIRVGQRVTISVDALGRDYDGYVEGLAGASGDKYSIMPPENATGNYVKVVQRFPIRIRFARGQDPGHRLRPGMSVEPSVLLR